MMGKYILQIQSFGIYDFFQINSKPILNFTVIKSLLGKGKGWQARLVIRLCGFTKALFTKNSLRCQCTAGVSGNVPLEKDIKNAGSPPTARKMKEYTLLVYNLLSEISLPKPLPVCFLNSHG